MVGIVVGCQLSVCRTASDDGNLETGNLKPEPVVSEECCVKDLNTQGAYIPYGMLNTGCDPSGVENATRRSTPFGLHVVTPPGSDPASLFG